MLKLREEGILPKKALAVSWIGATATIIVVDAILQSLGVSNGIPLLDKVYALAAAGYYGVMGLV